MTVRCADQLDPKSYISNKVKSRSPVESTRRYHAQLKYRQEVVLEFQTDSRLHAMAKLSSAISDRYPYARGEIRDKMTGQVIYRCCQTAIC